MFYVDIEINGKTERSGFFDTISAAEFWVAKRWYSAARFTSKPIIVNATINEVNPQLD